MPRGHSIDLIRVRQTLAWACPPLGAPALHESPLGRQEARKRTGSSPRPRADTQIGTQSWAPVRRCRTQSGFGHRPAAGARRYHRSPARGTGAEGPWVRGGTGEAAPRATWLCKHGECTGCSRPSSVAGTAHRPTGSGIQPSCSVAGWCSPTAASRSLPRSRGGCAPRTATSPRSRGASGPSMTTPACRGFHRRGPEHARTTEGAAARAAPLRQVVGSGCARGRWCGCGQCHPPHGFINGCVS